MSKLAKLLENYIDKHNLHFEGERGVGSLNKLAKTLGYKEDDFKYGSSLENFLSDNPGCMEMILGWIAKTEIPEWIEYLRDEEGENEETDD